MSVQAESFAVGRQRRRRRLVAHIVIAGHIVELDRRIELAGDTMKFVHLRFVPRFVDQIAANHHEFWAQSIGGGDRELKVDRLLLEILILGVHAELRI